MLEWSFLLLLGAPWPLAVWMAYEYRRSRGAMWGCAFAAIVLVVLVSVYLSGYRTARLLTGDHKAREATFALAAMTLQAYVVLAVAQLVRTWAADEKPRE